MKKRFSEQQITGFLKEAEAGMPVCRSRNCAGSKPPSCHDERRLRAFFRCHASCSHAKEMNATAIIVGTTTSYTEPKAWLPSVCDIRKSFTYTAITRSVYFDRWPSEVTNRNGSDIACATRSRSNGSR